MGFTIDINTKNKSFLETSNNLKRLGVKNNEFMLTLLDEELSDIDPYSKDLSLRIKGKIIKECVSNYWYFIREVIRVSDKNNKLYELNLDNLALNFSLNDNYNIIMKNNNDNTIHYRLLWEFLFGSNRSLSSIIDCSFQESKNQLLKIKDMWRSLPEFLQLDLGIVSILKDYCKELKSYTSNERLYSPMCGNLIVSTPSPNDKNKADILGRGCTQPRQWYNNFSKLLYNDIFLESSSIAFKQASEIAYKNKNPYGIIINIIDDETHESSFVEKLINTATKFDIEWYDKLKNIEENENSNYIIIN